MRKALLIAGLLAMASPPVWGGLYLPVEKGYWRLPSKPRQYQLTLDDRQSILPAVDPNADPKKKKPFYVEQILETVAEFEKKYKEGQITLEEGISLGGYYILLGKADNAILVMEEMYKRDKKDFMVIANLAMAYYARGVDERGDTYQSELVMPSKWPRKYSSWPPERLRWQLRAEQLFLALQRQRQKEKAAGQPGGAVELKLDNVFPGARFDGPDGSYAAGQTDSETEDALPSDAAALIEQLLLWMPQDDRLQWQLAEIYNAKGQTQEALRLMSKMVNKGLLSERLREHRRILEEAARPKDETPDVPPWQPDVRSAGIGGGIGFVVGMLTVFQLRQLFRRAPQTPARVAS